METRTNHIGTESQNEEEPKQDPQGQGKGQEKDQEPSQQQQDEERFQLLVADLFDSYHPGSALEDAALIRLARALWKRKDDPEDMSTRCGLDQEIDTALAQLSNSQAVRRDQELWRQGTGSMSSIRRRNPDWGLVRRSVGPQMRARPRCSKEALELWAPHGVGKRVSPAEAAKLENAKDHARTLELDRKKLSEGLTPDEEIERAALKDKMLDKHPLAAAIRAWEREENGEQP